MERQLEYWAPGATQPIPIRVLIGAPEERSESEWECTLTIEGFPREPLYSQRMHDVDAMGALSYALAIAPLHLRLLMERGGHLTWDGREDLHFPSMFSAPTHYFRLTPPGGGEPRKLGIRVGLPERIDGQWSVLVSCTDCKTWEEVERRVVADAWAKVLERALAVVPALLQAQVDEAGGGLLEEEH
jgi:hypothetical protein